MYSKFKLLNPLFLFLAFLFLYPLSAQDFNSYLKDVKYRNIGPFRGGRSVCATGVINDPLTYYMGTTGGGVWKTTDAGQRWENISDGYFQTSSVGAIAVSASDPEIIYVGMGEHAPRGVMTTYGDGVYKSTDAGKTWKKMGLELTRHIARIVIHPDNSNLVYVAAQGALHGPSEERGIYRSEDGGETWKKVLYVNDLTGCSELVMDPLNKNVLYATMWEHIRKPWQVVSGGEGSAVYKSIDGGTSWKKIENGLPNEMGKMAISVSGANPDKLYALIESDWEGEKGGLYVSDNGGENWSQVSKDHRLIQRSWYYTEVFTDPNNENMVYVLNASALRSIDGGKTWERLSGTHGDYHDLWINPENPKNIVIANDGGAAISFNRGETWSTQSNMPTAQFYRVNTDNLFPYNLYGGQQDNTSVKIASMSMGSYGISESDWTASAGGESAFLAFDPDNPRYVLGGSYLGTIGVLDQDAKASTRIMAAPIQYLGREARDMKYLFNWNAPIIRSQHEPNTFYHAAQLILKTTDMGRSWTEMSPDLTRNLDEKQGNGGGPYTNEAVGAENYGTISYMIESPHEKGVLWTGSDDGLVHLTKDGGNTWKEVTPKGLEECLINAIELSPHDPATAYIATTRYKFNDFSPSLYKTTNYGKSWTKIDAGIPNGAYTRVIREDTERKDMLFAGTETGMYISTDGGKKWNSFQLNLPVTPITDLKIAHDDLIVATMGRAFWILDDLALLRQMDQIETLADKAFEPEDIVIGNWGSQLNSTNEDFDGTTAFEGVNPANGIVFYYEKKDTTAVRLVIKDESGKVINQFSSEAVPQNTYAGGPPPKAAIPAKKGLNRWVWDMRHPIMIGAPEAYIEGNFRGHRAIPGTYVAEFIFTSGSQKVSFTIQENPLYEMNSNDYQDWDNFMSKMESNLNEMHRMVNDLSDVRESLLKVIKELPDSTSNQQLRSEIKSLASDLKAWDEDMVQRKSKAYDDVENFPNKFTANFIFLINLTDSGIPRVNEPNMDRYEELINKWEILKNRGEALKAKVPEVNNKLWKAGVGAIDN